MPFVTVKDGKIHSIKIEYNIVDHCNFSCDDCSHLSPWLSPKASALDVFKRDLATLEKVYHVRRFRFVGGEPFLHPDLLSFIRAVRESGIADTIQICSNGSLIKRVDERVFAEIDLLSISWYPDERMDEDKIAYAREMCAKHKTHLKVERIERFRTMRLDEPVRDRETLQDLYDTCQIAHSWYCQTFYEGVFYLCSRPIFTNAYLEKKGLNAPDLRKADGVPLDAPDLREKLLAYLTSDTPIASCAWCLGTVGKHQPWRNMVLSERKDTAVVERTAEQMVDRRRLQYLRAWAKLEKSVLKRVPSLLLARGLTMVKNAPIGD